VEFKQSLFRYHFGSRFPDDLPRLLRFLLNDLLGFLAKGRICVADFRVRVADQLLLINILSYDLSSLFLRKHLNVITRLNLDDWWLILSGALICLVLLVGCDLKVSKVSHFRPSIAVLWCGLQFLVAALRGTDSRRHWHSIIGNGVRGLTKVRRL
jgi:hypothetical protein